MAALPTKGFILASLKFWQAREARHKRALKRDAAKIALRRKQLKEVEQQHANRPTIMYDSVTLSEIPANAPAVAGYTSGKFPTWPELAKHWPKARRLSIAVSSSHDAECLDVEPGDATNSVAADWVKRQLARGVKRPVLYTSVSNAHALLTALAGAGIHRGDIRLWTAHYTFHSHLCGPSCGFGMNTVADATQWTDKALGRNLDQSQVNPSFWV